MQVNELVTRCNKNHYSSSSSRHIINFIYSKKYIKRGHVTACMKYPIKMHLPAWERFYTFSGRETPVHVHDYRIFDASF